ncbi:MAG: hypothetical protein H6735_11635 [Alphaproteobacteria bacterium]|nr:hypothetical protein [Alphaproteobacteria bacterium]
MITVLLLGCSRDPCADTPLGSSPPPAPVEDVFQGYDPAACVPDQQAYVDVAAPILDTYCNGCHSDPPAFGAPLPLTDYDALIAGIPGTRPVDRLAHRSSARTMPPPSSTQLPHTDLDSLVAWATCGEVHPSPDVGVSINAEVYQASVPDLIDLPTFDVVADDYRVERDTLDMYRCFAMDVPVDEERFIRRMQVVVDDARVLHHAVLAIDPDRVTEGRDEFTCFDFPYRETPFLYAWAPGTDAFDFEDGGLRIRPGDRIVVQIHYNNGAGVVGVRDRSGIRVFHGPVKGTEWFMRDLGPTGFDVPEGTSEACNETKVAEPMMLLAGMPHMHQLGVEMHQVVERRDGLFEPVFDLEGWNFESQRFYRYDRRLEKGDRLHTWCVYDNQTGAPSQYGEATTDEMCYHFAYVGSPP